jgi:hypothetical protein
MAALYVVRWFYTVTSRRSVVQRLIKESALWQKHTPKRNHHLKETSFCEGFCEGLLTVIGLPEHIIPPLNAVVNGY